MSNLTIITKVKFAQIATLLPFKQFFTYKIPDNLQADIGNIVEIEFGKKKIYGVICQISDDKQQIPEDKIKGIISVIPFIKLNQNLLSFIQQVSDYTLTPIGNVFKAALGNVKDLIKEYDKYDFSEYNIDFSNIKITSLTDTQQNAYEILKEKYLTQKYSTTLIDGVTGSGKTEVYFQLIEYILQQDNNAQILILLPEIALTSQLIKRFYDKFKFASHIWHSNLTPKKRALAMLDITNNKARIIIGARSALFLPYSKLSLIIIDEEHDSSFKQEEQFIYNARDMAVLRALKENIPIILSSATPSLETIVNVKQEKYDSLKLAQRFGSAGMPKINLIDLKQEKINNNHWITVPLKYAIQKTLDDKLQTLLFLNRKGYAPLKICQNCGFRFACPNCSSWLVEHRSPHLLRCHHCNYVKEIPQQCPECDSKDDLISYGPGIEKLAEEINEYFPEAKIAILSSDISTSLQKISKIMDEIISGDIDIIIGTQTVVKGHHFPKLTTVGIIDGDMIAASGDLRSSERTYQILHQVAGRAGREDLSGNVYIQTYIPENSVIKAIAKFDRDNFINNEIKLRKEYNLPPFARQIAIIISANNEKKLKEFVEFMARNWPRNNHIDILGPAQALMYKINKNYRYRFLFKANKKINLQKYILAWLDSLNKPSFIKIKIDVDPISFM